MPAISSGLYAKSDVAGKVGQCRRLVSAIREVRRHCLDDAPPTAVLVEGEVYPSSEPHDEALAPHSAQ